MKLTPNLIAKATTIICDAMLGERLHLNADRLRGRIVANVGQADLPPEDLVCECMYILGVSSETDWAHPKPKTRGVIREQLRQLFAAK